MGDDKPEGQPPAQEKTPEKPTGIAKRPAAGQTDMSLFEHYHRGEMPRRVAVYGVTAAALGAIVFEIAKITGPLIPEWVGIPLVFAVALPAWKLSKHVLRKLTRADPKTPINWREKPDSLIIRYATQRVGDLAFLERQDGWSDIYAQMKLIPDQLPSSILPWRQATRDKERQLDKQKLYPDSADARTKDTREAIKKAIDATQKRADGLDELVTQRLLIFDMVEAWFSAAQHTAGSDASAIKNALDSIKQINEDADSILQGVTGATEMTDPT